MPNLQAFKSGMTAMTTMMMMTRNRQWYGTVRDQLNGRLS